MDFFSIFTNKILAAALIAWWFAQLLKIPIHYLTEHTWDWALFFRAGGMPSSHSALITAVTHATGLYAGFDSPVFALAFAISMIVIYDATGIRRQAGMHASIINTMIRELARGHPLHGEQLREVLGHTPVEAIVGVFLGLAVAQLVWFLWR